MVVVVVVSCVVGCQIIVAYRQNLNDRDTHNQVQPMIASHSTLDAVEL